MTDPIDRGQGESAIDATDPKDQAMIRRAIMRNPGRFRKIVDARKDRWAKGLDIAQEVGEIAATTSELHSERIDGATLIVSSVKTGLMMAKMDQIDDHKTMDVAAPAGDVNVNVAVKFIRGMDPEEILGKPMDI